MKNMTIKTDKVIVENGTDFTFVCRKMPFSISCSELYQGDTNLIDLDLVNSMKIPLRNIRVTRMSILGHDVRAVGRIKQTVQCIVKGKVQGNVHLEGKVVRNLFSTFNVDCFGSSKTYERLMGRKPPDPVDEGYESPEDIPDLGGEEEEEETEDKAKEKKEDEDSIANHQEEEELPPDPPEIRNPKNPSLNIIKSDNPNYCIIEIENSKCNNVKVDKNDEDNDEENLAAAHSTSLYEHYIKFGPGPRDLQEIKLNSMKDEDEKDEDEKEQHCDLCFRQGRPIKIVASHGDRCPTCPSLTPTQKERIIGLNWKQQAERIYKERFNRERVRE